MIQYIQARGEEEEHDKTMRKMERRETERDGNSRRTSLSTHMVAWNRSGCDIVLTTQCRMGTTACMLNSIKSDGITRNWSLHRTCVDKGREK